MSVSHRRNELQREIDELGESISTKAKRMAEAQAELREINSSPTCESDLCANTVACTAYWPGQTVRICVLCADRAQRVAIAMGFDLRIEPVMPQSILDELERLGFAEIKPMPQVESDSQG